MKKSVYIVGGNMEYMRMFEEAGWKVLDSQSLAKADLVQFCGGADVSPVLYGEPNVASGCDWQRDVKEMEIFEDCLQQGIAMAGICRGGQFLNVMCGGRMWQDVDGHATGGTHMALDLDTGEEFEVTSTHHQMMRPSRDGDVVATAALATRKVDAWATLDGAWISDVEAVHYPQQAVFCFQPHPEFDTVPSLREQYFDYLARYLGV